MIKKILFQDDQYLKNIALLFLRVGIGIIYINFGFTKLMAGQEKWLWLGSQLQYLGISSMPMLFGFKAAMSEFLGGILLVLGCLTRFAAAAIACTMFVAVVMHISKGDGFSGAAFALSMLLVCISIVVSGGGTFSIDARYFE